MIRAATADSQVPRREALVDAVAVLLASSVAMYAFRDTFNGWSFLIAAVIGILLGIALAHIAQGLGQPAIVLAVFTIAAFFLLGGAVALHGSGLSSVLPVPRTVTSLADQSVNGWKELLTTLPPVDSGPQLAIPYLMGLVAGAGGMALARRTRSPALPALAPLALLAAVILLGVQTPQQVASVGGAFAAITLSWIVLRARRLRTTRHLGGRSASRMATAVVMCLAAVGLGVVLGPGLPGVAADRVVLRTRIEPPFDVGQYPSPLAGFRRYTKGFVARADLRLYDKPLLRIEGLAPGTRIRFAALDSYNGTAWGAANDAGTEPGNADTFQKVGSVIVTTESGPEVRAGVTVLEGYDGVWLPTTGNLEEIHFAGAGLAPEAEQFRYNQATDTAVMPGGLNPGDSYSFVAVVTDDQFEKDDLPWPGALPGAAEGANFQPLAAQYAAQAATPMEQVLAIAAHLRQGAYTDGEPSNESYRAGHSLRRLKEFVSPQLQMAGNDEQYAAMMAILANQIGVPTRVVMGAQVPESRVITGKDVHAWVEVRVANGSWRTLPTEQFMNPEKKPDQQALLSQQQVTGKVVPPPSPLRPPATVGDPFSDTLNNKAKSQDSLFGFDLPWYVVAALRYVVPPVLFIGLALGAIVAVKSRRRSRRRTRGTLDQRLAFAWRELLDQARDLGFSVTAGRTRREQARQIGLDGLTPLARTVDAHVFGAGEPTHQVVEDYWGAVEEMRESMKASLSRRQRLRAAVSLASLRRLQHSEGTA